MVNFKCGDIVWVPKDSGPKKLPEGFYRFNRKSIIHANIGYVRRIVDDTPYLINNYEVFIDRIRLATTNEVLIYSNE